MLLVSLAQSGRRSGRPSALIGSRVEIFNRDALSEHERSLLRYRVESSESTNLSANDQSMVKAGRRARIVSPAKAERLKRQAENERRAERNSKMLLIGTVAAIAAFFIGFCVYYSVWIKERSAQDHQRQNGRAAAGHDH